MDESAGTRRTQAERRAASEEAVLRAAAELIAERGVDRASLRGIGARAGISRAMPAYHFGSKDALVARLTEQAHERTLKATTEALAREHRHIDALPKLEVLLATIDTYLRVFATADSPEERAVVVLWGATFPAEAPMPTAIEADRRTHEELAGTIRDGRADGSIRDDVDPDAAAVMVTAMARGVAALSLTQPGAADTATVRALCRQAITAVLAP
ncbi:TetR/AcrR family transcriptional regulator [Yinghuangia sp. ASG 101]|uniref:TetR/AcrR family transcriptional regulator n=1 Tax=Yinghuangia sp. ASG 101 TaxID=2896848 RepID=UPI001E4D7D20|nr:TetR/AcrR family transcriptional regulator [Yinghuangia sp. ASG 101]UGQ14871.1 TetR/AcrR family transcriptional regulator [Yinghuangia sp. ASG 101]